MRCSPPQFKDADHEKALVEQAQRNKAKQGPPDLKYKNMVFNMKEE